MKLLLDQNLSYRMLGRLDSAFPGSSHVRLHGFEAATDTEIWNFAKIREFVIVTRDVDFFERSLILGSPPKVLWLNCGNSSTDYVLDLILQRSEEIRTLDSDPTLSCLELV